MSLIDSIIGAESGGNPNAVNPNSSAGGLGQFINSTWLSTLKAHRPDLAQGKSDDELLALKNDPQLSREMTGAYAGDNQAILQKNGLPVTDGATYLAHFAGPGGAVKVLQADPNAPVSDILGEAAVRANPFLKGMTAQGLQAWAAKKVGTTLPAPQTAQASPAAPANSPPGAPLSLAPPQTGAPVPKPPMFPLGASPQPQMQAAAPMPPVNAPPIFYPPAPQVDLSKLMAAFKPPVFYRGNNVG